jgi:hypothetical protein
MGYSIYVAAKSEEDQKRMFDFLEEHFVPLPDVEHTALRLATDVSYGEDDVEWPVGFDYSSWMSIEERLYVYTVMYWMTQVLTEAPYHFYYDFEKEPVPEEEDEAALLNTLNKWSFHLGDLKYHKEIAKFIATERDRLRKLWNADES